MKKAIAPREPKGTAWYELRLTVAAPWTASEGLDASQVIAAVRHHLTKAKVNVLAIGEAGNQRKKIVQTVRGDALPAVTRESIDDSRNPFELDVQRDIGTIEVFVEQCGRWVEVAYLLMPEQELEEETAL